MEDDKRIDATTYWFMHFSKLALDDVITEMIKMKFAYSLGNDEEMDIHFKKLKYAVLTIVRDSVDL